jgi:hypothetical protein
MTTIEHTGRRQDAERAAVALHVQLIARRAVERALPVRADLRADPLVAEEGEGSSRCCSAPDVKMEPPLSPTT